MPVDKKRIKQILADCESWTWNGEDDFLSNYEAFKENWGDIKKVLKEAVKPDKTRQGVQE